MSFDMYGFILYCKFIRKSGEFINKNEFRCLVEWHINFLKVFKYIMEKHGALLSISDYNITYFYMNNNEFGCLV